MGRVFFAAVSFHSWRIQLRIQQIGEVKITNTQWEIEESIFICIIRFDCSPNIKALYCFVIQ